MRSGIDSVALILIVGLTMTRFVSNGLLFLALMPTCSLARTADMVPVASSVVREQLNALSSTIERLDPELRDGARKSEFQAEARKLEASIEGDSIPAWQEWMLQQQLVRTLDDPHTQLYFDTKEDEVLPVRIDWVSDGIVVSPVKFGARFSIPKQSQLLQIAGYTPAALLQRTETLISGTPGFVRTWFHELPAYYLHWIGAVRPDGTVSITLRTPSGQIRSMALPLVRVPSDWLSGNIASQYRNWYRWRVDPAHDIGWFTLNQMMPTAPYEKAVSDFFNAVEHDRITRVAVDLRHDGGGWTMAEMPFFDYLGVRQFDDFGHVHKLDVRTVAQRLNRGLTFIQKNDSVIYSRFFKHGGLPYPMSVPAEQVYHGTFYVVTGPNCFSSAMSFAADVKFNRIGKVIGTPCGETVGGYGNIKTFMHPASGVAFQVPTKVDRWPGIALQSVVRPDISVPTTVGDVEHHVDPVHAWFDSHIGVRGTSPVAIDHGSPMGPTPAG